MFALLLSLACTAPEDTGAADTAARDTGEVDPDGLDEAGFRAAFVERALALWLGVDYTFGGHGDPGIDGSGTVVLTLVDMGYAVPAAEMATTHTLVTNADFNFTEEADASPEQLQGGDSSALLPGDLLILDYDFDGAWDHVAIYTGQVPGEALTASDYFDEVVLADVADYEDPFSQDLAWSQVMAKRLNYGAIEGVYTP